MLNRLSRQPFLIYIAQLFSPTTIKLNHPPPKKKSTFDSQKLSPLKSICNFCNTVTWWATLRNAPTLPIRNLYPHCVA